MGGNIKQIETRSVRIPINIKDRVKNCKKYFRLHNETMLIYDKNNILNLAKKEGFFVYFAMHSWYKNNRIFNIYNVKKIIYKNLINNIYKI